MFAEFAAEAAVAAQALREAAELCRSIQAAMPGESMEKTDHSPVTVADFASQALVGYRLAEAFPSDRLVAEEGSQGLRRAPDVLDLVLKYVRTRVPSVRAGEVCDWIDLGQAEPAERFWTLDPIDGTKGFLRGGQYAVALALIEQGCVVMAGLACPNLNASLQPTALGDGVLVMAVNGQGSWASGFHAQAFRRLTVSGNDQSVDARVLRSVEAGHTDLGLMQAVLARLGVLAPATAMDSQAKYAVVAGAQAELIFRLPSAGRAGYREKIWDQAAGSLVVEEAGGQVTDLLGKRLDFSAGRELTRNHGVLVSNAALHPAALEALLAVLPR
jgi:3'(2'), 5'-bisphosphate nucleotidase